MIINLRESKYFFQHLRDGRGAKHSLPVSADSPDVALGQESLHPPSSETSGHEETDQDSQQRVRIQHTCVQ